MASSASTPAVDTILALSSESSKNRQIAFATQSDWGGCGIQDRKALNTASVLGVNLLEKVS